MLVYTTVTTVMASCCTVLLQMTWRQRVPAHLAGCAAPGCAAGDLRGEGEACGGVALNSGVPWEWLGLALAAAIIAW